MIGSLVSFFCIVISIIGILAFANNDRFNMYIGIVVFFVSAVCFCIPMYEIQQRDLSVLLYYLVIMYHDLIFLLICGVLFGGWLWFICLSSFLIMSSILSTVFEFHRKEEIGNSRVLPRKTFLDDE